MRNCLAWFFHLTTILLLLLSLGANLTAIFGESWWRVQVIQSNTVAAREEYGLTRHCVFVEGAKEKCAFRKNLLNFDFFLKMKSDLLPDIILVTFLVAATFTLVSLVISLALMKCRRAKSSWNKWVTLVAFLTIIAALSSLGGMIYAQIKTSRLAFFRASWTLIVAWASVIGQFFAVVFNLSLMVCFRPSKQDGGEVRVRYDCPEYAQDNLQYRAYSQQFQSSGLESQKPSYKVKSYENRIIDQIENKGCETEDHDVHM